MNSQIITVEKLKKEYNVIDIFEQMKGKKKSVGIKEASFSVNEGEIFAIIGVNGAGKTTIMKCTLGLIKPDAGQIKVFGKDKLERKDYYNIGYLPEISYYPKEVKLKDIIGYYADLYDMNKSTRKKAIPEILEVLKLNGRENDRLEKFSKGMLQRVGIAQAVMNSPKLLFLDEPMTGLDPLGQKLIVDLVKKMKEQGTTVILNTHVLSDVEKLADRIMIVDKNTVKEPLKFSDVKGIDKITIETDKEYKTASKHEDKYVVRVSKEEVDTTLKAIIKNGGNIISVRTEEMTLEKYFMQQIL